MSDNGEAGVGGDDDGAALAAMATRKHNEAAKMAGRGDSTRRHETAQVASSKGGKPATQVGAKKRVPRESGSIAAVKGSVATKPTNRVRSALMANDDYPKPVDWASNE
ncbi:unnamed protein product [Lampetra planeri]